MEPFLYTFFHDRTNDRSEGGLVRIPKDTTLWPDSWKKNEAKEYKRSPKIPLSPQINDSHLKQLIEKRTAAVSHIHTQAITSVDLAKLLDAGYGIVKKDEETHRTVPSGGARYPLEVYVSVWGDVRDIPPGHYHFDARAKNLDVLPHTSFVKSDIPTFTNDEWVSESHGVILLSAIFKRSVEKYGSRGYRYILIEAGHVGQNICLAGAENGLAVRPLGGFSESIFEEVLQLDTTRERIIYALVF